MIVSRKQLLLEHVVDDNGLLQLNVDGSVVATNKKVFACIESVPPNRRKTVPLADKALGRSTVALTDATAREVLKNVPRDKLFHGALEHVDVVADGENDFVAETTDGRRSRMIRGRAIDRTLDADPVVKRILHVLDKGKVICLNRKRLLGLLETLERVAEDSSGESPVWIDLGEGGDVALRCVDWATGQRALVYMTAYQEEGARQPPASDWERSKATKHKPRRRA